MSDLQLGSEAWSVAEVLRAQHHRRGVEHARSCTSVFEGRRLKITTFLTIVNACTPQPEEHRL